MVSFKKLAQGYRSLALYFLNTVFLSAVVGGFYLLYMHIRSQARHDDPIKRYGVESLMAGYPGQTAEEVAALMRETYDRPLIFSPYTHFRELPSKGRFVNIAEEGYRLIQDQGPWPIQKQHFNVFVFGGSTTFGAGVADTETIPSALQRELRKQSSRGVCVYNFGRGFHYSSQERAVFSTLLAAGHIPDAVVFIDGLNEFYHPNDEPQFSGQFMGLINQSLRERKGDPVDMADAVTKRIKSKAGSKEEKAARIVQLYLRNKTTIAGMAAAHGVRALFVWQPVPVYKFNLSLHPFAKASTFIEHRFPAYGYDYFAELRKTNSSAGEVVWLADMQEKAQEQLYVDAVHYTAKMCGQIAAEIAQAMLERSAVPEH